MLYTPSDNAKQWLAIIQRMVSPLAVVCMLVAMLGYMKSREFTTTARDAEHLSQVYDIILRARPSATAGPLCTVEVDERGKIVYANKAFEVVFGLSVDDNILPILPERSRESHREILMQAHQHHLRGEITPFIDIVGNVIDREGKTRTCVIRAWATKRGAAAALETLN